MPGLIEWVIVTTLASIWAEMREYKVHIEGHKFALDALVERVVKSEKSHGATNALTVLKADIVGLRKDVDEMKSTNLSMFFGTVEIREMSSADVPGSSEIPSATTIGDDTKADNVDTEYEAETNEEQLSV
ncbi:uncharacterized protein LOC125856102 [Solanum stenotomum]|uniref:uncharacterized protein LOC125856102 n=1 Tax=Solanum stenotomum TaxID=172797 RepID=UPI0020D12F55|nr:uncharacterized protein LOC125856102 [Solanum stenotomum]